MKNIDKRLDQLEAIAPNEETYMTLGELYEWQETPEGQAELAELYGSEEENKKRMEEYHKDLRKRGLL
jgi:ABC-type enterochelin transport system substrate-binding protein